MRFESTVFRLGIWSEQSIPQSGFQFLLDALAADWPGTFDAGGIAPRRLPGQLAAQKWTAVALPRPATVAGIVLNGGWDERPFDLGRSLN